MAKIVFCGFKMEHIIGIGLWLWYAGQIPFRGLYYRSAFCRIFECDHEDEGKKSQAFDQPVCVYCRVPRGHIAEVFFHFFNRIDNALSLL